MAIGVKLTSEGLETCGTTEVSSGNWVGKDCFMGYFRTWELQFPSSRITARLISILVNLNWEGREDKNWYEFRVRAKDELISSGSHLECRAHRHLCKDISLTCPKLCPVYFLRSPAVARLWGLMWWGRVTPSQPISNGDFLFWWVWLLALCSVTGWWRLLWVGREKDDDKNPKCVEF